MNKSEIFNDSFSAMGTYCDVVLTGIETELAEQIFHLIKGEVNIFEQIFSKKIQESEVSNLNRNGKNVWIDISDELWNIISLSYDFYQMSNGAFDVTVSSLVNLWENKNNNAIFSEKQIKEAAEKSGFDKVELDFENQKLRFKTDSVKFDFGAIEKGYILDSLNLLLQQKGVENAIISFGENSILALGNHPNGEKWPLGIQNPKKPNEYVHLFSAKNETLSTSGTINNTGYIISPATGLPIEESKMISVKSESGVFGKFVSTTWLILPENDKEILSEQFKKIEILEVFYNDETDFQTKLTIL